MNRTPIKWLPRQLLSDHPSHGTRIQQLENWMPQAMEEYNRRQQHWAHQMTIAQRINAGFQEPSTMESDRTIDAVFRPNETRSI